VRQVPTVAAALDLETESPPAETATLSGRYRVKRERRALVAEGETLWRLLRQSVRAQGFSAS